MRKNLGFTLVEVLVAVALTGAILLTGYSTFQRIIQAQISLGATIDIQKNLFYTNEKLAALIRNGGTIDYEEYFNRRMLGYDRSLVDTSDTDLDADTYTFTNFSHFGNGNIADKPIIYFCGVSGGPLGEGCLDTGNNVLFNSLLYPPTTPATTVPPTYHFTGSSEHQAYGQYAALAFNYNDPVGYPVPIKLPPVFKTTGGDPVKIFDRSSATTDLVGQDPLNVGLPELYLIKKNLDNSYTRTYFRHVYVQDGFPGVPTCNPTNPASLNSLEGCLGKIQMIRLKGCDSVGTPGVIDAWIPLPEFAIGAIPWCPTTTGSIYIAAHEDTVVGESPNLTWVDVTAPDLNVIRATFLPKPLKIPTLMSGAGDIAQSPSISVYLEVQLSTKLRNKSFVQENVNYPRTLITTYDLSE